MKSLDEVKPGLTLGRYECLLPIARGGMAAVWAARVTGARGFEKVVAIKTMLPGLSDDPNFEQMFLDEARIASRIRHPNVAEILDLGEQDNLLYIVMEWVDGAPMNLIMRESFRRGGMPLNIAVRIIQDVCAALHAAHELKGDDGQSLQLVHRDVSPQNIMLTENGVVKLVDFGVAKALGRSAGETDTGLIRGKLNYLAPEQVIALPLDRRADLFSLGVILYQLTTRTHPFRADNAGATMNNILRKKVPKPSKLIEGTYPKALEKVVMRAIDREQEFRFQTGADMFKALDEVFEGRDRATAEDIAEFIKPIIGPKGDEFRKALRQASRMPSSPDNIAALLASGAQPVEGTLDSNIRQMPERGVADDSDQAEPSSKSPHGLTASEPPASLHESTMSGAESDARPSLRTTKKRKRVGMWAAGALLLFSVGLLFFSRFDSTSKKPANGPAIAESPVTTAEEPMEILAPTNVQVESAALDSDNLDASAESSTLSDAAWQGDTAADSALPKTSTMTPTPAIKRKEPKPSVTKPPATKKWTPAVSDPGF